MSLQSHVQSLQYPLKKRVTLLMVFDQERKDFLKWLTEAGIKKRSVCMYDGIDNKNTYLYDIWVSEEQYMLMVLKYGLYANTSTTLMRAR